MTNETMMITSEVQWFDGVRWHPGVAIATAHAMDHVAKTGHCTFVESADGVRWASIVQHEMGHAVLTPLHHAFVDVIARETRDARKAVEADQQLIAAATAVVDARVPETGLFADMVGDAPDAKAAAREADIIATAMWMNYPWTVKVQDAIHSAIDCGRI